MNINTPSSGSLHRARPKRKTNKAALRAAKRPINPAGRCAQKPRFTYLLNLCGLPPLTAHTKNTMAMAPHHQQPADLAAIKDVDADLDHDGEGNIVLPKSHAKSSAGW